VDLRRPLDAFDPGGVGGFVHSHVLEHIPGSLDRVVRDMNRALAPGGFHVFQAPIHPGWYREDMDPAMPPALRAERFYQDDHLRVFGAEDFAERVLGLFEGFDQVDLSATITVEELAAAMVPGTALRHFTGHSVFIFVKRA
jgi:SAM-dependent methyltransferase